MYQAPIFSILWAGWTTSEHSKEYMFHTLKSRWFHPLAVCLFTLNTIFMREPRSTARENNVLSAQSSCSVVHPSTLPRLVLQTCSKDTTLGSEGTTETSRPSDSPHLFWHCQFVTTLQKHSPCWELACELFYAYHGGHSMFVWCCLFGTVALRSNC